MAQSLELLTATVKYTAGQPRQTQFGERINVLVTLPDGTEQRLWGNPCDVALTALRKGQQVQLAKDTKGFKLVSTATPTSNGNGHKASWQGWTDDEKRAIAAKIQQQAKLYRYCFQTAQEQMGEFCQSEESLRAIATTLFLSALK